jgi:MFS family permease
MGEHNMSDLEQDERNETGKEQRQSWIAPDSVFRNTTLLSVSSAIMVAFIGIGMVVPVRVLYATEHGASLDIVNAMAGAFLLSSFLFQFPAGWVADKWGHRRIMLVSLLFQAGLSASYIFILDPLFFVGVRFLEGICSAALLPAARALIVGKMSPEQQGRAFGVFTAFFNAGFLLGPGIGGLLGYTGAFLGSVVMRILAIGIVLLFIRTTLAQQRETEQQLEGKPWWSSLRELFSLPLVGAYLIAFGDYIYLGFDQTIMPIWLSNDLGASLFMIGVLYMCWSVPNILLSPLGGRLADRFSRPWLIFLCALGQIPVYMGYGLSNSLWMVFACFIIHGVFYAFMLPAVDAHVASASPSAQRGRVQGMYAALGFLGALVGSNGASPLYAINFRLPLFAMGAAYAFFALLGCLLIFLAARQARQSTET